MQSSLGALEPPDGDADVKAGRWGRQVGCAMRSADLRLDRYTSKAYIWNMLTFVELAPVAAVRDTYLDDQEFAALQQYLGEHPDAGDLIPRSGGCRKLRWAATG